MKQDLAEGDTVRWYVNGWRFGKYLGPNPDSDNLANVLYLKEITPIRYDELEAFSTK